jgi:hypothetical protein
MSSPPSPESRSTSSRFKQPGTDKKPPPPQMTLAAQQIADRVKEIFYAYTVRQDRSTQTTLGPSEIGTPCDRRLAYGLAGHPRCNPGGDGWAAFVGTCIHDGLSRVFEYANAGTGRFAVETRLNFPSELVPYGTGDLLDRSYCLFLDHKSMGGWSLDKLRSQGPSETYRVQVQTYAYGADLRGEDVRSVAIVAWPRERSTLDNLWVWEEPYDPEVGRQALARVQMIQERLGRGRGPELFDVADDCKFCPWHMPGAKTSEGGMCNGKR